MIWALSPDHFALAWETTGLDLVPQPLLVRPTARTMEERQLQVARLNEWWHSATATGPEFEAALATLAEPTVRIEIYATDGPDGEVTVRILGVTNGHTAVVVTQDRGPDASRGGTLHLQSVAPAALVRSVVGALPPCGAGREPAATMPAAELQGSRTTTIMYDPFHIPEAQRVRRLLHAPREALGHLLIGRGRPEAATPGFSWIDVIDNGRYLVIRTNDDLRLVPATADVVVGHLTELVGQPPTESISASESALVR